MRNVAGRIAVFVLAFSLLVGLPVPIASAQSDGVATITITEDYIAYLLETQLPALMEGQDIPLEDPQVDLVSGGRLNLTAGTEVPMLGAVEPTITLGLTVADNTLDLAIEGIALEGLTVPANLIQGQIGPIEEMAESQANQALADLAETAGIELTGIETTDTTITVRLRPVN